VATPETACYLGFDYGKRSIGIAVGQTLTNTATALTAVAVNHHIPQWHLIDVLIKQWHPAGLVVGWPIDTRGNMQKITHAAQAFGNELSQRYQLPIHYIDERYTTSAARAFLLSSSRSRQTTKSQVDAESAKIILEDFFNHRTFS
jgi:putative holliday junction resolvase